MIITVNVINAGTYNVITVPADKIYVLKNIYYSAEKAPGELKVNPPASTDVVSVIDNYNNSDHTCFKLTGTDITQLSMDDGRYSYPPLQYFDMELIGQIKLNAPATFSTSGKPTVWHFELEEVEVKGSDNNVQTNE